ncbi:hypothetical protein CMQ_5642 [Grosmannia clavigera kw1407]|uniref:Uncharacterized protein n=1 Tax=Grosmannia clavigera (strain kw1407 / UAMH 11150) TaxID=655863 RepID=F0XT76_GROCL|nr:uncharacterized protein CMQ_5642 [Grosmannia clavigera kw1407]EFW99221.1 hypothetical protein CMQ_5642 [Grosmannia clavigera kw1407]
MSKNNSLLNYWSAVPAPEARTTGSGKVSKPASAASASPNNHPLPLPRAATPPTNAVVISSGSPSSQSSSDDSFPPSPIRIAWQASSPPPQPALIRSGTAGGSSQARRSDSVVRDSDDDDDCDDGDDNDNDNDNAESLQAAVRFGQPLSSSCVSSYYSSIVVARSAAKTAAMPPSYPSSDSSSTPPHTKRRANTLLSSPLALRRIKQVRVARLPDPPKHKFDMKALLRHAEQDDATEAAVQRVSAAFAGPGSQQDGTSTGDGTANKSASAIAPSGKLSTFMIDSFISLSGEEAGLGLESSDPLASMNKDRLRRAFDRTGVAAVSEQWYFFKEHFVPSPVKKRPFPQKAAKDRWTMLKDATMRYDCFSTGLVRYAMEAADAPRLPDELFLWILDEASTETLPSLRDEYAGILCRCPEQVRRFVDAERLLLLFQKLGPRWESIDLTARLELVPAISRPYPGRDWTPLRSLLTLVATLAAEGALSLDAVRCASKILLRLGIDRLIEESLELLQTYQDAMRKLVLRVSASEWVDYCYDVGLSLYNSVQKPSLRWQVLVCLPTDLPACHELRRRLTAVFLFDDAERARQDPRRTAAAGQGGLARLAMRDDLVVTADTNYADLVALVNMLDVYVDDAGGEAVDGHTAAAEFDADVDELARRLQAIGRGIEATSGGHMSRLESKTALDRVQIRLTHAVRTRRPGRRNIFGPAGSGGGDASQSRQKDIRSFFQQQLAKKKT